MMRTINPYIFMRNLEAGWYPDVVDRDVDSGDEERDPELETPYGRPIWHEKSTAVDDNL